MALTTKRPIVGKADIFDVKRAAKILGVCTKTIRKYRELGLISPVNPHSLRPKYSGQSLMQCWDRAVQL